MTKEFCKELAELCIKFGIYLETDGSSEVIKLMDLDDKKIEYEINHHSKYSYILPWVGDEAI